MFFSVRPARGGVAVSSSSATPVFMQLMSHSDAAAAQQITGQWPLRMLMTEARVKLKRPSRNA
jgi:hypothetical protein